MSKFKFVGFQESVEIPEGYELITVSEEVLSHLDRDQLFLHFSDISKISHWLVEFQSLDLRPGGKGFFNNGEGELLKATCISVNLGRDIAILTDLFGQLNVEVEKVPRGSKAHVTFSILTDDPEKFREMYSKYLSDLKKLVSV
jgi:hypothetical protein